MLAIHGRCLRSDEITNQQKPAATPVSLQQLQVQEAMTAHLGSTIPTILPPNSIPKQPTPSKNKIVYSECSDSEDDPLPGGKIGI